MREIPQSWKKKKKRNPLGEDAHLVTKGEVSGEETCSL